MSVDSLRRQLSQYLGFGITDAPIGDGAMPMTGPILTYPTEAELATAVSAKLYTLFRAMQALPGCEVIESDQLS
jgi:hypothetical protein